MQKQYKLYILDLDNIKITLSKLYEKFTEAEIVILSENNIAVQYDYDKKDYKYVLEKMNALMLPKFYYCSKFYTC
jgi:hypothetical protein